MKTLKWLLVGALFAVSCFAVARAGPGLMEPNAYFAKMLQPDSADDGSSTVPSAPKFGASFTIDTRGTYAALGNYSVTALEQIFGRKDWNAELWLFGGGDLATEKPIGGGAIMFSVPIAKGILLQTGPDLTIVEKGKLTWAWAFAFTKKL